MARWNVFCKASFSLFLCLPCIFSASFARSGVATSDFNPIVLRETLKYLDLDPFCRYVNDSQGRLSIEQIAAMSKEQWARRPSLPLNGGYLRNPVWVRLSFLDSSARGTQWYLSLMHSQLDTVELYQIDNGRPKLCARTGRLSTHTWPAVSNRLPTFALPREILDGNATALLRISTTDVCAISLRISEGGYYQHGVTVSTILFGIYFGAIAAIAFFNLFLFFWARFVSCLWYCLWVVSIALFQASACGHWSLISGLPLWFLQNSAPLFVGSSIFFGSLCTTKLLEIKEFNVFLARIFIFFNIICVFLPIGTFIDEGRPAAMAASLLAGICVLFILVAGALSIKHRGRTAVFFTSALSMLALGVLLNVGRNFGVLPNTFITAQGNLLGSIFEVILLAIALIDRIATIQKEKAFEREKAQVSERLATESRLQALQTQIHPHFLFNTLNTIAEMTSANSKKAEKLVTNLSRLFRYTLSASLCKNVLLAEEMKMIETYLAIEKERFGSRLEYSIEIQGNMSGAMTMGLILQPIVENAIKHGISPLPEGGRIDVLCRIENTRIYIKVKDSGDGFGHSEVQNGTQFGLRNVEERMRLAFGKAASLSCSNENGAVVEISLPRLESA